MLCCTRGLGKRVQVIATYLLSLFLSTDGKPEGQTPCQADGGAGTGAPGCTLRVNVPSLHSTAEEGKQPNHWVTSFPLPKAPEGTAFAEGSTSEHHTRLMQKKTGPWLGRALCTGDGRWDGVVVAPQVARVTGDCRGIKTQ